MAWPLGFLLALSQFPVVESADFTEEIQNAAVAATVRVVDRSRKVQGSGVVVGSDERGVYVLTAAHLIDRIDRIAVETFTAKSYPKAAESFAKVELIARSNALRDLALLRLPPPKVSPGVMHLAGAGDLPAKTPFSCLIVGCLEGKPPVGFLDRVVAPRRARREDGEEPALFWEVAGKQAAGQSGGPLVDRRGFVLGICSGNNKDRSYFCHAEEIKAFLTAHDCQWLLEAKPKQENGPKKDCRVEMGAR